MCDIKYGGSGLPTLENVYQLLFVMVPNFFNHLRV